MEEIRPHLDLPSEISDMSVSINRHPYVYAPQSILGEGSFAKVYLVRRLSSKDDSRGCQRLKPLSTSAGRSQWSRQPSSSQRGGSQDRRELLLDSSRDEDERKGLDRSNAEDLFACKVFPLRGNNRTAMSKIKREACIQRELSHEHIVGFHAMFSDVDNLYIILEYCNQGTLEDHLRRNHAQQHMEERVARNFGLQLLDACTYMTEHHVVHRDLKLQNLFLHDETSLKVGDFGLARKRHSSDYVNRTLVGTPNYVAPEILTGRGHTYKADVWSFGVIMYSLLCGSCPFESRAGPSRTLCSVTKGVWTVPKGVQLSSEAFALLHSILILTPERRPTWNQIQLMKFFSPTSNVTSVTPLCHELSSSRFVGSGIHTIHETTPDLQTCEDNELELCYAENYSETSERRNSNMPSYDRPDRRSGMLGQVEESLNFLSPEKFNLRKGELVKTEERRLLGISPTEQKGEIEEKGGIEENEGKQQIKQIEEKEKILSESLIESIPSSLQSNRDISRDLNSFTSGIENRSSSTDVNETLEPPLCEPSDPSSESPIPKSRTRKRPNRFTTHQVENTQNRSLYNNSNEHDSPTTEDPASSTFHSTQTSNPETKNGVKFLSSSLSRTSPPNQISSSSSSSSYFIPSPLKLKQRVEVRINIEPSPNPSPCEACGHTPSSKSVQQKNNPIPNFRKSHSKRHLTSHEPSDSPLSSLTPVKNALQPKSTTFPSAFLTSFQTPRTSSNRFLPKQALDGQPKGHGRFISSRSEDLTPKYQQNEEELQTSHSLVVSSWQPNQSDSPSITPAPDIETTKIPPLIDASISPKCFSKSTTSSRLAEASPRRSHFSRRPSLLSYRSSNRSVLASPRSKALSSTIEEERRRTQIRRSATYVTPRKEKYLLKHSRDSPLESADF